MFVLIKEAVSRRVRSFGMLRYVPGRLVPHVSKNRSISIFKVEQSKSTGKVKCGSLRLVDHVTCVGKGKIHTGL
jgi:hypothetical protein